MSAHKYYNNYRKVKKEKITESSIPSRVLNLLKETEDENTRSFLSSLKNYYDHHDGLTKKQFTALADIEKASQDKSSTDYENWRKDYNTEKRAIAKICAHYYRANPPYYAYIIEKVVSDDDFVPTEKQYKSMCGNKYTQKVIRETFATPKFKPGALVKGRKTANSMIQGRIGAVIETDAKPIVSAAKGSKFYSVLFFGDNEIIYCEERYLKTLKKLDKTDII